METELTADATVPRNPLIGLAAGVGWALAAAAGFVVFADFLVEASSGDLPGRSGPFILVTPFILSAFAVFCLARGLLAIGPRTAYRNRTSLEQHRAAMASKVNKTSRLRSLVIPGVLVAAVALFLFGAAITSAFTAPNRFSGPFLLLEWAMLATIIAAALLTLAGHVAHYRRFAAPSAPNTPGAAAGPGAPSPPSRP